jgi:[ribosomal protein S18]-alanine N-acetyltransferase
MIFGFSRSKAPLIIRPTDMEDARAVAEIHAASFDRPWGLMEFERLLAEENIVSHAAAHDGGSEGFVLSRLAADEAEILSIAVHPRRRGEGIAGRLLSVHREALMLNRIRTLFLEVEEGNAPAIALYQRQGFSDVSRRDAYYRKADGSAATAIVMRRSL